MNKLISYILTIIITTIIVGGGVYIWQHKPQVDQKQQIQPSGSSSSIAELKNKIASLEKLNKEAKERYKNANEDSTERMKLCNSTFNNIKKKYGEPTGSLKIDKNKEIWVYATGGDASGLYMYFENKSLVYSRYDEYNGVIPKYWFKN